MQPRLLIIILPRETDIVGDRFQRYVHLSERQLLCAPYQILVFVRQALRCAQVIGVIEEYRILPLVVPVLGI